jgi:hypothetical protein
MSARLRTLAPSLFDAERRVATAPMARAQLEAPATCGLLLLADKDAFRHITAFAGISGALALASTSTAGCDVMGSDDTLWRTLIHDQFPAMEMLRPLMYEPIPAYLELCRRRCIAPRAAPLLDVRVSGTSVSDFAFGFAQLREGDADHAWAGVAELGRRYRSKKRSNDRVHKEHIIDMPLATQNALKSGTITGEFGWPEGSCLTTGRRREAALPQLTVMDRHSGALVQMHMEYTSISPSSFKGPKVQLDAVVGGEAWVDEEPDEDGNAMSIAQVLRFRFGDGIGRAFAKLPAVPAEYLKSLSIRNEEFILNEDPFILNEDLLPVSTADHCKVFAPLALHLEATSIKQIDDGTDVVEFVTPLEPVGIIRELFGDYRW